MHIYVTKFEYTLQARKQEEFEDIKGVIRIRKSQKNRQHNGQKKRAKATKHAHKTKDRVTRNPLSQVINTVIVHEVGKCLPQVEHHRGPL
jgi:hypothetical protein